MVFWFHERERESESWRVRKNCFVILLHYVGSFKTFSKKMLIIKKLLRNFEPSNLKFTKILWALTWDIGFLLKKNWLWEEGEKEEEGEEGVRWYKKWGLSRKEKIIGIMILPNHIYKKIVFQAFISRNIAFRETEEWRKERGGRKKREGREERRKNSCPRYILQYNKH